MIARASQSVNSVPSPQPSPERAALRKAAEGFEAIMVRKLLETARTAHSGEDIPLTGGGRGQFEAMRDEHFADVAAQSGAFGFARTIEEQLAQFVADTPAATGPRTGAETRSDKGAQ